MRETVLQQIQKKVRDGKLILTIHAEEEMDNDDLLLDDVINAILTGEIRERQKDRIVEGWKHLIEGTDLNGDPIEVVAKLGATGKVVIITVYRR